eukprot:11424887-Alexandrium_andersonii.AAC.1
MPTIQPREAAGQARQKARNSLSPDPNSEESAPPPEELSFALEAPCFARRLQGQGQNQGGADLFG